MAAYGALASTSVAVAIGANAAADSLDLGPAWLISAPTVAAAFGLLYKSLDAVAWRWLWVRRLGLVSTPVVEGTYEGELVSSYQSTRVPIRLCIEQSWSELVVKFEVLGAVTSTSRSIAASLSRNGHSDAQLTYTYKNEVRPGVAEDDMHDHDGTADLVISPAEGTASGRYFNARGRQGTMSLQRL